MEATDGELQGPPGPTTWEGKGKGRRLSVLWLLWGNNEVPGGAAHDNGCEGKKFFNELNRWHW